MISSSLPISIGAVGVFGVSGVTGVVLDPFAPPPPAQVSLRLDRLESALLANRILACGEQRGCLTMRFKFV